MMFTQRYPQYFDGVIAGAPAMSVATGGLYQCGMGGTNV